MATYDNAPAAVREAIREGARLTGVDETALSRIIGRESAYNPYAANPKSSARGLGQHIDSTWEAITKSAGGRYGITPQTSRFDPRASVLMTAELMKQNAASLRAALGRAPSDGEVYAAHFLGAAGAAKFLRAADANPNSAAADLFPEQASANRGVFFDKSGGKRSVLQVLSDLSGTSGDPTGVAPILAKGPMPNLYSESPPEAAPPSWLDRLKDGYIAAAEQEQTQTIIGEFLLRDPNGTLAPDPNFRWSPELIQEITADLPEDYANWVVENAHSKSHAEDLRKRSIHEMDNEAELAGFGLMGNLGLRGAAILTDVPTWLIGAGAGKLAGIGRLGKLAMAGRAGLLAAAESVPAELLKHEERAAYGLDDVLLNTTTAFAFGAGFAGIFGKSGAELDKEFVKASARADRDVLDANGVKLNADGEAHYEQLAGPRQAASGGAAATPPAEGKAAMRFARADVIGRLMGRGNRDVQDLASKLDIDAVGDGGATVRGGETAYEHMRRLGQSMDAKVRRATETEYRAWADRQGLSMWQRVKARDQFNEAVYRETYMPSGTADENVSRAAEAYRNGYRDYLAKAKKAGAEWAQDVNPDDLYTPIVFDKNRVREFISKYDEAGVVSVIAQAMRAANKTLSEDIANRAAEKYLRTVTSVVEGTNSGMVHILSGQDRKGLADLLVENGMSTDEAEAVVQVLKPSQETGPGHFKRRTLLDDVTSFSPVGSSRADKLKPSDAFSIRDLTVQDAEKVWDKYSRQMSGQIAMVQRGFQNRGSFEAAAIAATKGMQNTIPGYTDSIAASDLRDLQYLGKTIYGIPVRDMNNVGGKLESVLGSFNFMRFMGQSGIAQLGDMPKIMLKTSISAAFKTFRLADMARVLQRGGQEADALARDLEVITGVGTINARGRIVTPFHDLEDFYPEDLANTALDRAVRVSKTGANVTSMVSGMVPVTDFLGRWATRAHMQSLADVVRGVKKFDTKFLNDMGLGPDELARFKGLVDRMEIGPNGVVRDLRLKDLQKVDAEGVDLLGAWVSRQARLTVLEPTPGMLPKWLGESPFRLLAQFRSFSAASHAANTLHNLKMGPAYAGQSMIVTGAWASLVYMGQTYMRSIGQPDREAYLEKTLNPVNIAASAFNKSADSGMLPMMIDSAMWPVYEATGTTSPFAYGRTTGLAAGIAGIPVVSLGIDAEKLLHEAVADTFRDDKVVTREDVKRFNRLVPFNNTYGIANAMNAFAGLFPEDEPANERPE